jgi:rubrerythrin
MVTLAGTQNNEKDLVEALLQLEQNALEAYDETIERLENKTYSAKIAEFRQDHYNHVEKLSVYARRLGVEIPEAGAKSLLTKGKVVIADMVGDDDEILTAMKTNEYETVMAYENACKKDFLSADLRALCEQGLADEKRHRDWMDQTAKKDKRAA